MCWNAWLVHQVSEKPCLCLFRRFKLGAVTITKGKLLYSFFRCLLQIDLLANRYLSGGFDGSSARFHGDGLILQQFFSFHCLFIVLQIFLFN